MTDKNKVVIETDDVGEIKTRTEQLTPEEKKKLGLSDYIYRGRCVRVVDGDTYDILCDLGFGVYHKIRVRLRGVDTPEKYGKNKCEEGEKVSALVHDILFDQEVLVRTYKNAPSSFNRWEADVFFEEQAGITVNLAHFLVLNHHGKPVDGYDLGLPPPPEVPDDENEDSDSEDN